MDAPDGGQEIASPGEGNRPEVGQGRQSALPPDECIRQECQSTPTQPDPPQISRGDSFSHDSVSRDEHGQERQPTPSHQHDYQHTPPRQPTLPRQSTPPSTTSPSHGPERPSISPGERHSDVSTVAGNTAAEEEQSEVSPSLSLGECGDFIRPTIIKCATDSCPEWFRKGFLYLQSPDLGGDFRDLLKVYFRLEESSRFANGKGTSHALSSKHRPEAVHWWISRARTGRPPIRDVNHFANEFWTWWCRLQPAWRKLSIPVSTQPVSALRTVAGEWTELDKPGSNGFLSVIAALNWWGAQIEANEAQSSLWNAALADVSWVMGQLIEARSVADNGNPK